MISRSRSHSYEILDHKSEFLRRNAERHRGVTGISRLVLAQASGRMSVQKRHRIVVFLRNRFIKLYRKVPAKLHGPVYR